MVDRGESLRAIAAALGRSPSTISREISRNPWRPSNTSAAYTPYRDPGLRVGPVTEVQYRAVHAHERAQRRQQACHQPYRMVSDRQVDWVIDRLRRGWTPQEISGRLAVEFPDDESMQVSVETLYAWIYSPAQARRELWQYLPRGQKKRRKRCGRRVHSQRIKWRASIHDRPAHIEDRLEFGHWEADSIVGAGHSGGIHTEVERVSRYTIATRIERITAEATLQAQLQAFSTLPASAVRSITADNGSEFAYHYKLADQISVPTYFADPYSAYQRGTNEHFNGRIRRYLPKGTRFDTVTDDELAEFVAEINNRPRKVLNYHTPAEVYEQLCSEDPTRCTSN